MNTFEEISTKLYSWAKDRNIITNDNSSKQLIKLGEESGELFSAYLKQDEAKEKDSIGDILVVLSIYCHQRGININECFNLAWNEIKARKGKTVNGTFIKDETTSKEFIDKVIQNESIPVKWEWELNGEKMSGEIKNCTSINTTNFTVTKEIDNNSRN